MKVHPSLILLLFISNAVFSQHIFPEKFEGCITDEFWLEKDSMVAIGSDKQLVDVIIKSIDEKSRKRIKGFLSLQIIVDLEGNSCLLSINNETNVESSNMTLKEKIDSDLKWNIPVKKVAVLVKVEFTKSEIIINRLMLTG